ncbi:hypothetical protein DPMN_066971 [Dreissena polymorpha]|uniref:Uncharacterized protein n=1 Tax=Dreissena polymorpha TaxID=45954 RepID=A0A9D3YYE3_DREPO|nr:hypothetical protein DPMN_066971 [Dreissena polymorpha]
MKPILSFGLAFFALFANVVADKKCFCHVALPGDRRIIKDLGVVDTQRGWLWTRCRRMINCPNICDKAVKDWSCHNIDES